MLVTAVSRGQIIYRTPVFKDPEPVLDDQGNPVASDETVAAGERLRKAEASVAEFAKLLDEARVAGNPDIIAQVEAACLVSDQEYATAKADAAQARPPKMKPPEPDIDPATGKQRLIALHRVHEPGEVFDCPIDQVALVCTGPAGERLGWMQGIPFEPIGGSQ